MKRDAKQKLSTFYQLPAVKKASFLAGTSFHFQRFLFRKGFNNSLFIGLAKSQKLVVVV